jgi:pimeloyl-ACP methyl ester carboxylesterase
LFEAAFANLNFKTAARFDTHNPNRGSLLIIAGGQDVTVPESVSRAEHKAYRHAPAVTDSLLFKDRSHSITIDHGWREVAEACLQWLASKGLGPVAMEMGAFRGAPPPEARPR